MHVFDLKNFVGGWFVGNFVPSIINTKNVEVAIKHYVAGHKETSHYHAIADEITVIVSGAAKMNGLTYHTGDVIHMQPGESTDFVALTDTTACVVKMPSVIGDKYTKN